MSIVIPTWQDSARAKRAVESLLRQDVRGLDEVDIIVVDDGSDAPHRTALRDIANCWPDANVRIVQLEQNVGRSAARNAGARASTSEAIIFLDCDCIPSSSTFIQAHIQLLTEAGVAATTGNVTGLNDAFWGRYQTEASARRRRQFQRGTTYSGSSQNLGVNRRAFEKVGGFDPAYSEYGFEDRDLLIRLTTAGRLAWSDEATVIHTDILNFVDVAKKMRTAAGSSAALFHSSHPIEYHSLGYAAIDCRLNHLLAPLSRIPNPILSLMNRITARITCMRSLPHPLKAVLVKAMTALNYLVGTGRYL